VPRTSSSPSSTPTAEFGPRLAQASPAGFAYIASRGRWLPARHLLLIADRLCAVARGEVKRLMVFMPPRSGKSELISRYTPAWFLGRNPDKRVMLASYGAALASTWGRKARDELETWGRPLFGVQVSGTSKAGDRWDIEGHEGGMVTAGVGGPLTGRGADLLIVDDPIKDAEEAASEVIRAKHVDWWKSTARTRLMPGGAAVLLQTRWNEADLAGQLLADMEQGGDRWEVLSLPALATGEDDPLGRAEGEPLWPEMFDADTLEATRRALGSYYWSALYMQTPSPDEGMIYLRRWWQLHDEPPPFHELVVSWDCAFKDTDGSDYVVGQVWGRDLANKHLVCQVRARMEFTETLKAVKALRRWVRERYPEHKQHPTLVEDKANGPAVISSLRRQVPGLIPVEPEGSKEARARAVAPEVEAGNVWLPRGVIPAPAGYDPTPTETFIDEAAGFPNAAHDDQVDAMGQALRRFGGRAGARADVRTGRSTSDRYRDR
jgi:predicted phage terminase large subunit-like protein